MLKLLCSSLGGEGEDHHLMLYAADATNTETDRQTEGHSKL